MPSRAPRLPFQKVLIPVTLNLRLSYFPTSSHQVTLLSTDSNWTLGYTMSAKALREAPRDVCFCSAVL